MMIKRKVDKFWFPWWPEKWLWGTIRIECTPAERGIWVDLLSLASKDDGHIRANEEIAYPLKQLAGMLILPEKELDDAINKFIRLGKLIKTKTRTIYVAKWDKYQFSERHKRRVEEGMSEKEDMVSKKTALKYSTLNNNTLNDNKINKSKIEFSFEERKFLNITPEDKSGWKEAYPAVDIEHELSKMREWLLANPSKRKSNYRKFITNWLSRQQDKGGTKLNYEEKRKKGLNDWVKKPLEEK